MNIKVKGIVFSILAAVFYALSIPCSKVLLNHVDETMMASLLYLGAGLGILILSFFRKNDFKKSSKLDKKDLPFVILMVLLDILAPISLMYGLKYSSGSSASLLSNFEIVATTIVAFFIFKEKVGFRTIIALILILISSLLLSINPGEKLVFSLGSIFILVATISWGFENNMTRKISSKNTYEIVIIKGIFSALGSFIIAMIKKESFPLWSYAILVILLGFVSYGLSIFLYVKAQNLLGASKTSAFYAIAPFVGSFFSFVLLRESLSVSYFVALFIMAIGTLFVVSDTLREA